jgi:hypothetical protein
VEEIRQELEAAHIKIDRMTDLMSALQNKLLGSRTTNFSGEVVEGTSTASVSKAPDREREDQMSYLAASHRQQDDKFASGSTDGIEAAMAKLDLGTANSLSNASRLTGDDGELYISNTTASHEPASIMGPLSLPHSTGMKSHFSYT